MVFNTYIRIGDNFLNRTERGQALKSTIKKRHLMKLENFCKVKDTVNRTKWKSTKWEKLFSSSTYDRGANIQNTYKELKHRLQQTK